MKPAFKPIGVPSRFVLRESECALPGCGISVTAALYGSTGRGDVRLFYSTDSLTSGWHISADMARALAAELIACADALDAQVPA